MFTRQQPHSSLHVTPNVLPSGNQSLMMMNRSSSSPQMNLNHPYLQRVQQGTHLAQRGRMSPPQQSNHPTDPQPFSPPLNTVYHQSPILNVQAHSNIHQGMSPQQLLHHQSLNQNSHGANPTLKFLNEDSVDDLYSLQEPSHSETLHSPRSTSQNIVPSSSSNMTSSNTTPLNTTLINPERINSQLSSKVRHIPRQDPFFHHLEYSVKLAIGAVSCSVSRVYCLRDASEYNQFKQYHQQNANSSGGFLDVWLNLNDLSHMRSNNTLETIIGDGFQISQNGMRISVGRINLDPNTQQLHESLIANHPSNRGGINIPAQQQYQQQLNQESLFLGQHQQSNSRPRVYRLLHCLFNPGRSFCLNREFNEEVISIPQGYDSVYLQPSKLFDDR